MIARARAWARRTVALITDPHAAAESDALVASFMASAVKAGLVYCVIHPDRPAVTTVEVNGTAVAVCVGCLDLAGPGWGLAA